MAGYRIDINDARNAPVAPLEPPGGGQVPVTGSPQTSDETNTARTIGEVVTRGPHDGISATYDPATRALSLRLTGAAQPGALGGMEFGQEDGPDPFPIPGPKGEAGRDGAVVQVLYEDIDPEPPALIPGPKGEAGAPGAPGGGGSAATSSGSMLPIEEDGEDWMWLAGAVNVRQELLKYQINVSEDGNVRLGGRPYDWGASFRAYEAGDGAFGGGGGGVRMVNNAYNDGTNWRYKVTAGACWMQAETGGFRVYTAVSGSAGATVTPVQRLAVDTNGQMTQDVLSGSGGGHTQTQGAVTTRYFISGTTAYAGTFSNHEWRLRTNDADRLVVTNDGRFYGTALHNNAGAVTGTATQYIASGTYTPTLTNTTNIAASVAQVCQWMRVGNVVTVSGGFTIDPTTANTFSQLDFTLPIASALAAAQQCAGAAFLVLNSAVASVGGAIRGDTVNDRASLAWVAGANATSLQWYFTFTYVIV